MKCVRSMHMLIEHTPQYDLPGDAHEKLGVSVNELSRLKRQRADGEPTGVFALDIYVRRHFLKWSERMSGMDETLKGLQDTFDDEGARDYRQLNTEILIEEYLAFLDVVMKWMRESIN